MKREKKIKKNNLTLIRIKVKIDFIKMMKSVFFCICLERMVVFPISGIFLMFLKFIHLSIATLILFFPNLSTKHHQTSHTPPIPLYLPLHPKIPRKQSNNGWQAGCAISKITSTSQQVMVKMYNNGKLSCINRWLLNWSRIYKKLFVYVFNMIV